ncbi:MAG: hypothetical protein ABL962_16045, partial [Fimbriimonadaceae bacterium]
MLEQGTRLLTGLEHPAVTCMVAPDSSAVAATDLTDVVVWDAYGHLLHRFSSRSAVTALAFTVDAGSVLVGDADGTVKRWSLANGGLIEEFYEWNSVGFISTLAVSADGSFFAAGHGDGKISLWNIDPVVVDRIRGKLRASLPGHPGSQNNTGFMGRIDKRDPTERVLGHGGSVNACAIGTNAEVLFSGGDDCTIRTWAATKFHFGGDVLRGHEALYGHTTKVVSVEATADGSKLITASGDGTVLVWDINSLIGPHGADHRSHLGPVNDVSWSNDGESVAACGDDGRITQWTVDG